MKLAFVLPWYGENITGGAETEARMIAENLARNGVDVEFLTTCAQSFRSDWNTDYFREGPDMVNGIPVRRFKVRKRDTAKFDRVNSRLMSNIKVTEPEETVFMEEMINSPGLYNHISEHKGEYDYFVFIPYMFGTTYYGALLCPEKAVLIPCLHDESYARMKIYEKMFSSAKGIIFLSGPEEEFAKKRFGLNRARTCVLGGGVDTFEHSPDRFREKYGIHGDFILYAGRKEQGKNTPQLVSYFRRYLDGHDGGLKLVLIGPGKADIPEKYRDSILDLGYVPAQDKYDAYSAATIFCNPSVNESFSIVIMESWLCQVPVIVNASCDVTREHCIKSNAGLFYDNYEEFEACVDFLLTRKEIRDRMGRLGRKYVQDNYSWDVVVDKYKKFFGSLG
jgi:glycosyltransferase involved in cell wall biosynthesis